MHFHQLTEIIMMEFIAHSIAYMHCAQMRVILSARRNVGIRTYIVHKNQACIRSKHALCYSFPLAVGCIRKTAVLLLHMNIKHKFTGAAGFRRHWLAFTLYRCTSILGPEEHLYILYNAL